MENKINEVCELSKAKEYNSMIIPLESIRDQILFQHFKPTYKKELMKLLPILREILVHSRPIFPHDSKNSLSVVRKLIFEIYGRIPCNQDFENSFQEIFQYCFRIIGSENETNGVLIVGLLKKFFVNFTPLIIKENMDDILNLVLYVFKDFQSVINNNFLSPVDVLQTCYCLKILKKYPLILLYLCKDSKEFNDRYNVDRTKIIRLFIGSFKKNVKAPDSPNDSIKIRRYIELIKTRVNILKFLSHFIRFSSEQEVSEFRKFVPKYFVEVLKICPSHLFHQREKLLEVFFEINHKNVYVQELFEPFLPALLNKRTLLGKERTENPKLCFKAYSTLAELVVMLDQKKKITYGVCQNVVKFYLKVLFDNSMYESKTICCKLISKVSGTFVNSSDRSEVVNNVLAVVKCFNEKLGFISKKVQKILKEYEDKKSKKKEKSKVYPSVRYEFMKLITPREKKIYHVRKLFYYIIATISSLVNHLTQPSQVDVDNKNTHKNKIKEYKLFISIWKRCLECCKIFVVDKKVAKYEVSKIFECIVRIFQSLSSHAFANVFQFNQVELLFQMIMKYDFISEIAVSFLKYNARSKIPGGFELYLLCYITKKLDDVLGGSVESNALYGIVRTIKKQILSHPSKGKMGGLTRQYFNKIVTKCLDKSTIEEDSYYFLLIIYEIFSLILKLRNMRIITSDLKDNHYFTFIPSKLNKMFSKLSKFMFLRDGRTKFLAIMIFLELPLLLGEYVAYFEAVIIPIICALESSKESLVTKALCFIEQFFSKNVPFRKYRPIADRLFSALFRLCQPVPNNKHGVKSLKLLSKFPKKYINDYPVNFRSKEKKEAILISMYFKNKIGTTEMGLDPFVKFASQILRKKAISKNKKMQIFSFLRSTISTFLDLDCDFNKFVLPKEEDVVEDAPVYPTYFHRRMHQFFDPHNIQINQDDSILCQENNLFRTILSLLFLQYFDKEMKEEVESFIVNLLTHFSLSIITNYQNTNKSLVKMETVLEAILDLFLHHFDHGVKILTEFVRIFLVLCEGNEKLFVKFDFWGKLIFKFVHYSNSHRKRIKKIAIKGLGRIFNILPNEFPKKYGRKLFQELLYSAKHAMSEKTTIEIIKKLMKKILDYGSKIDFERIMKSVIAEFMTHDNATRDICAEILEYQHRKDKRNFFLLLQKYADQIIEWYKKRDFDRLVELPKYFVAYYDSLAYYIKIGVIPITNEVLRIEKIFDYFKQGIGIGETHMRVCFNFLNVLLNQKEVRISSNDSKDGLDTKTVREKILKFLFEFLFKKNNQIVIDSLNQFFENTTVPSEQLRNVCFKQKYYEDFLKNIPQNLTNMEWLTKVDFIRAYLPEQVGKILFKELRTLIKYTKQHLQVVQILKLLSKLTISSSLLKEVSEIVFILEEKWTISSSKISPFRDYLAVLLDQHPNEAYKIIINRKIVKNYHELFNYFDLFIYLLSKMRQVRENMLIKLDYVFKLNSPNNGFTLNQVLRILKLLVKMHFDYFLQYTKQQNFIFERLFKIFNTLVGQKEVENSNESVTLFLERSSSVKLILKILFSFFESLEINRRIEILFLVIPLLCSTSYLIRYSYIVDFIQSIKFNGEEMKQFFGKLFELIGNFTVNNQKKITAFSIVNKYFLVGTFDKDDSLHMDDLQRFIDFVGEQEGKFSDDLKVEIIKFFNAILNIYRDKINFETRTRLITFSQNMKETDNPECKVYSLVLLTKIVEYFFDTTDELTYDTFKSLLLFHSKKKSNIVQESLSIVVQKLEEKSDKSNPLPKWFIFTKKVFNQNLYSLSKLIHFWRFIRNNEKIIYNGRSIFFKKIVNSLRLMQINYKISAINYSLHKVSVRIVNLMIDWYEKNLELPKQSEVVVGEKRKVKSIDNKEEIIKKLKKNENQFKLVKNVISTPSLSKELKDFGPKLSEVSTGFILRSLKCFFSNEFEFKLRKVEPSSKIFLSSIRDKCVDIIKRSFTICKVFPIDFSNVISLLSSTRSCLYGLKILLIILENNPTHIDCNIKSITEIMERIFKNKETFPYIEKVLKFISGLLKVRSINDVNPITSFYKYLWKQIDYALTEIIVEEHYILTNICLLRILFDISKNKNEVASRYSPLLIKLTTKAIKKHQSSITKLIRTKMNTFYKYKKNLPRDVKQRILQSQPKFDYLNVRIITKSVELLSELRYKNEFLDFFIVVLAGGKGVKHKINFDEIDYRILLQIVKSIKPFLYSKKLVEKQKLYLFTILSKIVEQRNEPALYQEFFSIFYNMYIEGFFESNNHELFCKRSESTFYKGLSKNYPAIQEKFLKAVNDKLPKNLHSRFSFIFNSEIWKSLKAEFWITIPVDLLCDLIDMEKPLVQVSTSKIKIQIFPNEQTKQQHSDGFKKIIGVHSSFLIELRNMKLKNIFQPLRFLSLKIKNISYKLWVELFVCSWRFLDQKYHKKFQQKLVFLIERDYNQILYFKYPNPIQALLEGMKRLNGIFEDLIPPEELKYLAICYNGWNMALPLLEKNLLMCINNRNVSMEQKSRYFGKYSEIVEVLKEDDYLTGIWRSYDINQQTKSLLSIPVDLHEQIQKTLAATHKGLYQSKKTTPFELSIWEKLWLRCGKKMQQWGAISKIAEKRHSLLLHLEGLWNEGKFKVMKDIFGKYLSSANIKHIIFRISTDLIVGNTGEGFHNSKVAILQVLKYFCALPLFYSGKHKDIIMNFIQLYEMYESSKLVINLDEERKSGEYDRFKQLLMIKKRIINWRYRVPEEWENIECWNAILKERHYFFQTFSYHFDPTSEAYYVLHNESISVLIQFCKILRKHGLYESAENSLERVKFLLNKSKMYDKKLRFDRELEFLKLVYSKKKYQIGLDIMSTNSSFQPSRDNFRNNIIFRMKGKFLHKLHKLDFADKSLSEATEYFTAENRRTSTHLNELGKIFKTWGRVFDERYSKSKKITDLESSTTCYCQSIRFRFVYSHLFSRVFWFFLISDQLTTVFTQFATDIPVWIYLPYIENLLIMLQRDYDSIVAKNILMEIILKYPNAVYFPLKSLHTMLNLTKTKENYSRSGYQVKRSNFKMTMFNTTIPLKKIENFHNITGYLVNVIKQSEEGKHLEGFYERFINSKFLPDLPEKILKALEEMIIMVYREGKITENTPKIFQQIINMVYTIDEKLKPPQRGKQKGTNPQLSPIELFFIRNRKQMKEEFGEVISGKVIMPISKVISICKKWSSLLRTQFTQFYDFQIPIEYIGNNILKYLQMIKNDIEVPGQYTYYYESRPHIKLHDRIHWLENDCQFIERNKIFCKCLNLVSDKGNNFKFLVYYHMKSYSAFGKTEERTMAFFSKLNFLLRKFFPTRKKNLQFRNYVIIPITDTLKLIQEKPKYCTFESIYYDYCWRNKKPVDNILRNYWKLHNEKRDNAFIFYNLKKQLPKDILNNYVAERTKNWCDLYQIRKRFSKQLGLYALISHLFDINLKQLHEILIGVNTGDFIQYNFIPSYSPNGSLVSKVQTENVSFRFTQNIQNFITEFGVKGFLRNTLSSFWRCLNENKFVFDNFTRLYIRDELIAWQNVEAKLINPEILHNPRGVMLKVDENLKKISNKIKFSQPTQSSDKATLLINTARDDSRLANINPVLFPWF